MARVRSETSRPSKDIREVTLAGKIRAERKSRRDHPYFVGEAPLPAESVSSEQTGKVNGR